MEPFATPDDLENIWRPLTLAERAVATARIAQASRKIRREILGVDARIDAGTLDSEDVKDITVEMVKRVMAVPSYIRQQSITVDDATKSTTFDSTVSGGRLFITDEERGILIGTAPGSSGAFEIVLGS